MCRELQSLWNIRQAPRGEFRNEVVQEVCSGGSRGNWASGISLVTLPLVAVRRAPGACTSGKPPARRRNGSREPPRRLSNCGSARQGRPYSHYPPVGPVHSEDPHSDLWCSPHQLGSVSTLP